MRVPYSCKMVSLSPYSSVPQIDQLTPCRHSVQVGLAQARRVKLSIQTLHLALRADGVVFALAPKRHCIRPNIFDLCFIV